MLEESDINYIAGLIDGEGTITITRKYKTSKFRMPVISCSSTTIELLEYLQSKLGGSISKHKVYKDNHLQSWSWKITYNQALLFCEIIGPHLKEPKKRQRCEFISSNYKKVTQPNGKYTEYQLSEKLEFESKFFTL